MLTVSGGAAVKTEKQTQEMQSAQMQCAVQRLYDEPSPTYPEPKTVSKASAVDRCLPTQQLNRGASLRTATTIDSSVQPQGRAVTWRSGPPRSMTSPRKRARFT